jgi:hypothetical protein
VIWALTTCPASSGRSSTERVGVCECIKKCVLLRGRLGGGGVVKRVWFVVGLGVCVRDPKSQSKVVVTPI